MPEQHRLQGSRHEWKYLVDERRAQAIRDFALCYLTPDKYAAGRPNHEYPVHSLYLDSPDLVLYRSTVGGHMNRFKLRIRFYDDHDGSPVFCEIKRRQNDVILKQRAAVRRAEIARLLAGSLPGWSDLANPSDAAMGALQTFCALQNRIQAHGRVYVSYMREAYESRDDNSARLTLDRRISGSRFGGGLALPGAGWTAWPGADMVVLELKFTDRFPLWMRDLVRFFNLERCSCAKYVNCTRAVAEHPLAAGPAWLREVGV